MYRIQIMSKNYTFIECIVCQTLQQADIIKSRLVAMGFVAGIFNVL